MIKLTDLLEKKMTPAQKKKRGEIFDKLKASGMSDAKAGAIATSKAMSEKLDPVDKEDDDIDNDGDVDKTDKYLLNRRKAIAKNIRKEDGSSLTPLQQYIYDYEVEISGEDFANGELENIKKLNNIDDVKKYYGGYRGWEVDKDFKYDLIRLIKTLKSKKLAEGEDHEVAMAVSSLKSIAEAIVELRQKLGNTERNIPGWIQDHIAKAENYIEQAAQGFHELKDEELDEAAKVRKEPVGGRRIELIISSKDKAEVEKEIENIENKYPSAGYGTMVKKEPYQKGDTWIAVVRRSTTSN